MTVQDVLRDWFRGSNLTPEQAIATLTGWIGIRVDVRCTMTREELLDAWTSEEIYAGALVQAGLTGSPSGPDSDPGNVVDIRSRKKGNTDA